MNERDKKKLQLNNRELINNLVVSDVADFLYERGVLTQDNVEALFNDKPEQKAARRLVVSILPRKGPDAFVTFCDALRDAEYAYLADKLERTKVDEGVLCGDSRCKNERNTLLKTSRNLEDELEDLKQTVRKVSVEAENVKSEQLKVKSKVDDLEYENFVLKKQLSFYEEKEDVRRSHDADFHKSRSTGSFGTKNVYTKKSSCVSTSRGQRNSFGGFASVGELDQSTDSDPPDDVYRMTPLYDELDNQFLDTLLDCGDDAGGSDNAYYDDVDGPKQRPEAQNEASCAVTSASQLPRLSHRSSATRLSQQDDAELHALLSSDIIGYFTTGEKTCAADLDAKYAQYVLVMRRAVDSMSEKHGPLIEQISRQVDISLSSWPAMLEQLAVVFNDFLADDFNHSALFWGRTVAIYTLAGCVARRSARRRHNVDVQPLRAFLTTFANERLADKIRRIGGWVSCSVNAAVCCIQRLKNTR